MPKEILSGQIKPKRTVPGVTDQPRPELPYMSNVYTGPVNQEIPGATEFSNATYAQAFGEGMGYPQGGPAAPAIPQFDARASVMDRINALKAETQAQFNTIDRTIQGVEAQNQAKMQAQQQYDQFVNAAKDTLRGIDEIDQLEKAGHLPNDRAQYLRAVLAEGRSVANQMFPKPTPEPKSTVNVPQHLQITATADDLQAEHGYDASGNYDPIGMLRGYKTYQTFYHYNERSSQDKQILDLLWLQDMDPAVQERWLAQQESPLGRYAQKKIPSTPFADLKKKVGAWAQTPKFNFKDILFEGGVRMRTPDGDEISVPLKNAPKAILAGAVVAEPRPKSETYKKFYRQWQEEQRQLGTPKREVAGFSWAKRTPSQLIRSR